MKEIDRRKVIMKFRCGVCKYRPVYEGNPAQVEVISLDEFINSGAEEPKCTAHDWPMPLVATYMIDEIPHVMGDWDGNGDMMTIQSFKEACMSGMFIDYDGFGYYSDGEKESSIIVVPSDWKKDLIDHRWSHVIWYNR